MRVAVVGSTLAFGLAAVACGYEFGGATDGGEGGAAGSSTRVATSGADDASSSGDSASTGETASGTQDAATATASATTADASSTQATTSGIVVNAPCFADDFSNFDNNGWMGSLDQDGSGPSADAVAEGPDDGAFRSYSVMDCFATVTFEPDTGARIYADVRQSAQLVFGIGVGGNGVVALFEGTTEVATSGAAVTGVDALGFVFGPAQVDAYYRATGGWALLGTISRPPWLDDATPQIGGFGIYSSDGVTLRFHDFSLANPTN